MPCSGCSALHGVNSNFFQKKATKTWSKSVWNVRNIYDELYFDDILLN